MDEQLELTEGEAMPESTELVERKDPTPMTLIAAAIDSGVDPDKLERLIALQERWEGNQAEKAFAAAMHAAQNAMPTIGRYAENTHTKKKYALLESIQKQAKPIYSGQGFSLSFGEDACPLENHKRTICDVTHVDGHCRRYHPDLPVDKSGSMNPVQGCISTTSYAQRRLLCMVFNVTIAGEDDDGNGPTQCITGDQIAELNGIMDRIHPDEQPLAGLLKWAGVDCLDKLPAVKFETAKRALLAKVPE